MTGERQDGARLKGPEKAAERKARLEQELRANLLKRKAQMRAREGSTMSRKNGRQTQA
ncbi:MAG: hypothetical protein WD852_00090 [Methyloceanibacter sp.]